MEEVSPMTPINTFNVPSNPGMEFSQAEVNSGVLAMEQQFQQPEASPLTEGEQNTAYIDRLHAEAYEQSLRQEQELTAERSPEKCIQMIEACAVNVSRMRRQYVEQGQNQFDLAA